MVMTQERLSIDDGLTLQDKVRYHLRDYGQRDIPITMEKLSQELGKPEASVYQVINNLRKNNEIELEKESTDNGREKIVGIRVNRLQFSNRTYKRTERSGPVVRIIPDTDRLESTVSSLENTRAYLEKKLAVEDMRNRALQVGLKESVISFDEDPQAEEAVLLLKLLTDLRKEHEELTESFNMRGYDLEAAKRDILYMKQQLREETDTMLRNG